LFLKYFPFHICTNFNKNIFTHKDTFILFINQIRQQEQQARNKILNEQETKNETYLVY